MIGRARIYPTCPVALNAVHTFLDRHGRNNPAVDVQIARTPRDNWRVTTVINIPRQETPCTKPR